MHWKLLEQVSNQNSTTEMGSKQIEVFQNWDILHCRAFAPKTKEHQTGYSKKCSASILNFRKQRSKLNNESHEKNGISFQCFKPRQNRQTVIRWKLTGFAIHHRAATLVKKKLYQTSRKKIRPFSSFLVIWNKTSAKGEMLFKICSDLTFQAPPLSLLIS